MAMIAVLFDPRTGKLLGRGGRWVSVTEFDSNRPEKFEDLIPIDESSAMISSDPSPTYKCINHVVHLCIGLRCYPLGTPC